jgi:tight adherence protein C
MVKMLNAINDPTILISFAGFFVIFLFCIGVLQLRRRLIEKKKVLARIRTDGAVIDRSYESVLPETNRSAPKSAIFNIFMHLGNRLRLNKTDDSSSKQMRFLKAGIRNPKAGLIFWGVKCFLAISFLAAFLALRFFVFSVMNTQLTLVLGVLIPFLGFYLPDIWLLQKTEKRQDKLLKALPDALDLMVVCVEAGMGLDEAINRVAEESKLQSRELSDEFVLLSLELRAGKQRKDALKNLAERTQLEEVKNLVTLLIQADKFGTNIADTLRVYSDSFRTERFQRAEEMAAKMPVKLIFPLILFIFPALFIVIIGPAIISIYRNFIMRF